MSISVRSLLPLGALVGLLALPAGASAATLRFDDARAEVRQAARMEVRDGEASSFRIVRCERLAQRRIRCIVRFRDVRREGRTCRVPYRVKLRAGSITIRTGDPVCRS